MPRTSPFVIALSSTEEHILVETSRRYSAPYYEVVRTKIVLSAASGTENEEIFERLDVPRPIVSKWRKRFFFERLDGLEDLPRCGRTGSFSPSEHCRNQSSRL
jgi:transposase